VLTAAHCVFGKHPTSLKIRAGEWDTQTRFEIYAHEDRVVGSIKVHEDFAKGNLLNDVALLFLTTNVTLRPTINTVCLPPQDRSFDSQRCVASGWGKSSKGEYSKVLKKMELPIIPHTECQTNLQRKTTLGPRFSLHESFMCAGGENGKDMCEGDGGAPLVCRSKLGLSDRYYQTGIVSWVSDVLFVVLIRSKQIF
jgi:plasma kallikrein